MRCSIPARGAQRGVHRDLVSECRDDRRERAAVGSKQGDLVPDCREGKK
jgi:hypothetical protein